VLLSVAGGNVVRFAPPFVVTDAELDEGVAALDAALAAADGFYKLSFGVKSGRRFVSRLEIYGGLMPRMAGRDSEKPDRRNLPGGGAPAPVCQLWGR